MESEFIILLDCIFDIKDKGTLKDKERLRNILKRELDLILIEESKK